MGLNNKQIADYIEMINTPLDHIAIQDIKEIPALIEALKSLIDPNGNHQIASQFEEDITSLKEFYDNPDWYVAEPDDYKEYQQIILDRIQAKIDELSTNDHTQQQQRIEEEEKRKNEAAQAQAKIAAADTPLRHLKYDARKLINQMKHPKACFKKYGITRTMWSYKFYRLWDNERPAVDNVLANAQEYKCKRSRRLHFRRKFGPLMKQLIDFTKQEKKPTEHEMMQKMLEVKQAYLDGHKQDPEKYSLTGEFYRRLHFMMYRFEQQTGLILDEISFNR